VCVRYFQVDEGQLGTDAECPKSACSNPAACNLVELCLTMVDARRALGRRCNTRLRETRACVALESLGLRHTIVSEKLGKSVRVSLQCCSAREY
jgi:hypothetical protein